MTPAAKIRFVKNRIEDKIAISPIGPVVFRVADIYTNSFTFLAKDQYSILKKLQEDGFIKGLRPLGSNDVWFEMTGKPLDPFGLLAQNRGKTTTPKPIKDTILYTKDLKPEMEIAGLASYSDGTIRYKGTIIPLREQIRNLCRMFMRNPKRTLTREDIIENTVAADKQTVVSKITASKYISELRNSLKVHFKRNVIHSQKSMGWYFDPNKNS